MILPAPVLIRAVAREHVSTFCMISTIAELAIITARERVVHVRLHLVDSAAMESVVVQTRPAVMVFAVDQALLVSW